MQRWENVLATMKQTSDARFERDMAQRQAFAPPTTPTSPQMMVLPGYLKSQSVNGSLRYCSYSNGVVSTVASVTLCPMNTQ
jgi:hypothetical protein